MMLKLENDNQFYSLQQKYGLQQVIGFSWKETTLHLLKIYMKIQIVVIEELCYDESAKRNFVWRQMSCVFGRGSFWSHIFCKEVYL